MDMSAPKARGGRREVPLDWGKLSELLEHFALIYGTDTVIDKRSGTIMKVGALRLAYGNDQVKFWLNGDDRQMVTPDQIVFDPSGNHRSGEINLFKGLPVKPEHGRCDKLLELLSHLSGEREEVEDWLLRWLAYPLQNPGAKMRTSIVMSGDEGSGKNLFFDVVAKIYGPYASTIGQDQLESKFNDWASKKQFIIADEVVSRSELTHSRGKLKSLITGREVMIEAKMLPVRAEANHMNVVFLSNETQPIAIEDSDRRFMVIRTPGKLDASFYEDVAREIEHVGPGALYHHLLSVDLGDFNEHTKPLMLEEKASLITLGRSPVREFLEQWVSGQLPFPLLCVTTPLLYSAFKRWCDDSGERFPPPLRRFSAELQRFASDAERDWRVKKSWVTAMTSDGRVLQPVQRTCILVTPPPEGMPEREHLDSEISKFIDALQLMGFSAWRM